MKLGARLLVLTLVVVFAFGVVAEASGMLMESTYIKNGLKKYNGFLNEWYIGTPADLAELHGVGTFPMPVDMEGFIFSMWDDNYLYFGGEIYDDDVLQHDNEWGQDRIAFMLNTRPGGTRTEEIANVAAPKFLPGHYMFTMRPFWAFWGDEEILSVTRPTDEGFSFEMRIPWSKIQFPYGEKPKVGTEIGIIILVTDWQEEWKAAPEAVWGAEWSELWQWDNMATLKLIATPEN